MYQRYTPNRNKQHIPSAQHGLKAPNNPQPTTHTPQKECTPSHINKNQNDKHPVSSIIPPALYNHETQKVLGLFSTEDVLLVALIILLLEDKDSKNSFLILALLYILISDYIDLSFLDELT